MSLGILFAYGRLYFGSVYCTVPQKINAAGRVSTMVFDKTGTLTHDGLTVVAIKTADEKGFDKTIKDPQNEINALEPWKTPQNYQSDDILVKFTECMACWHNCTYVNDKLIGDHLETEMFKLSRWAMDEDEERNIQPEYHYSATFYPRALSNAIQTSRIKEEEIYKLQMIKKFEFSSELQRMSVVVKNNIDGSIICFIKGSPEIIKTLWDPSKVPLDYNEQMDRYTSRGFRVIALAYRQLSMKEYEFDANTERTDIEKNLTLLGFLIFENKLKSNTTESIRELQEGI
jgi:cation-transporting P-type ATPase 13A2